MKIGFLGFGNMAQAMAGGLVRSGAVQPGDIRRVRARPGETAEQHGAAGLPGFRRRGGGRGVRRSGRRRRETLSGRGGACARPGASGEEDRRIGGRGRYVRRLRADARPRHAPFEHRSQYARFGLRRHHRLRTPPFAFGRGVAAGGGALLEDRPRPARWTPPCSAYRVPSAAAARRSSPCSWRRSGTLPSSTALRVPTLTAWRAR